MPEILREEITEAAYQARQSDAEWVRRACAEKLERDAPNLLTDFK